MNWQFICWMMIKTYSQEMAEEQTPDDDDDLLLA